MTRQAKERLNEGACVYLADMILEVQQLALRLGAGTVSSQLQRAYLETEALRRGMSSGDTSPNQTSRLNR